MPGGASGIARTYLVTGKTDMRRSIDGLRAMIRDTYQMKPYANALYLFCGKRCNTIKALYFDKDGFCLIYKRLDSEGRFQWPRNVLLQLLYRKAKEKANRAKRGAVILTIG